MCNGRHNDSPKGGPNFGATIRHKIEANKSEGAQCAFKLVGLDFVLVFGPVSGVTKKDPRHILALLQTKEKNKNRYMDNTIGMVIPYM